jgi:hypothetical protein
MSTVSLRFNRWQKRLDDWLEHRQDVVLMAPYMAYLILLALRDAEWLGIDYDDRVYMNMVRGFGALLVVWLVRNHLPKWGKPYWWAAIPAGIAAAVLWVGGQHLFNALGVPSRLPLPFFGGPPGEPVDPRHLLGAEDLFWTTVVTRIATAVITVPIIEELFWRAFLLRALISWSEFEKVPLGKYTFYSFIGTSLLSAVQHPDNWLVSVFCWMLFNALFYWRPSILFITIVHGVTNLVLYVYVVRTNDWMFW